MTKKLFLEQLRQRLQRISQDEQTTVCHYYDEIISDKIEEGMTEEQAVASLGDIDQLVTEILSEQSIPQLIRERVNQSHRQSSNKTVWVILAILGSPIWLSLVIALISVIGAAIISLMAVAMALVITVGAFILSGPLGLAKGILLIASHYPTAGLYNIGAGLLLCGLGILLIRPICEVFKVFLKFGRWFIRQLKNSLIRRRTK